MKITRTDKYGLPKAVTLSNKTFLEEVKKMYQELVGPIITEVNRTITTIVKALTNGSDTNDA